MIGSSFWGDEAFSARADAVADFLAVRGRWPRTTSDDLEERSLGRWLVAQRQAFLGRGGGARAFTEQRRRYLDVTVPGWMGTLRAQGDFVERVCGLAEWVAEHGRFPTRSADADDREVREAIFLHTARTARATYHRDPAARTVMLWTAERETFMDVLLGEQWKVPVRRRVDFEVWVAELATFVHVHGRLPVGSSSVTTGPAERRLGTWLKNRRQDKKTGRLSAERVASLNQAVPGWDSPQRNKP